MPYFTDLNTYLHQSSLLIQAYPSSTRITTKYSLPRKPNSRAKSNAKDTSVSATESAADATTTTTQQPKRDRSATLTLKTFHPQSGICLKYQTDKAAEVGRLLNGLGRLAKGEIIEVPTNAATATAAAAEGDTEKMDIDGGGAAVLKTEEKIVSATPAVMQNAAAGSAGGGGGKGKKKKGKK